MKKHLLLVSVLVVFSALAQADQKYSCTSSEETLVENLSVHGHGKHATLHLDDETLSGDLKFNDGYTLGGVLINAPQGSLAFSGIVKLADNQGNAEMILFVSPSLTKKANGSLFRYFTGDGFKNFNCSLKNN